MESSHVVRCNGSHAPVVRVLFSVLALLVSMTFAPNLGGAVLRAPDAAALHVLPQHDMHYSAFERIAIGWNGSPEAMRAVHAALPFLRGKRALLLWGEERDLYHGVDWDPPFNIMEYLRKHGVAAEQHFIAEIHDDVGAVLLDEALKFGADLFVMGAYGRSRFSEWMLGGATRHMLTWAEIPVLLRH